MRLVLLTTIVWLAAVSRCEEPRREPPPEPRPGDTVRLRGTLSEDVDCRLFRADGGRTYSLSARLQNLPNGSKVCIRGTLAEATQCMTTPTIEVQSVSAWASCP